MLGWFKKKFRKQDDSATQQTPASEELSRDTPFSAGEQPEIGESAPLRDQVEAVAEESREAFAPPPAAGLTEERDAGQPADRPLASTAATPPEEPPAEGGAQDEETGLKVLNESQAVAQREKKKKSLFARLAEKLGKTRETLTYQIDALFLGKKEIDAALIDDLEEVLITADLGVETTMELLEYIRRRVSRKELDNPAALKEALKEKIKSFILENDKDPCLVMPDQGPFVIMVIGVNGVGKTTTIGKIAHKFQQAGSSVLLVAADTFRAAAVAQLQIWGQRNNVPVVAHKEKADPSSVVFDGLNTAVAKKFDVVLVDTAGRLHTNSNLMEELKKIKRVMEKKLPGAPHEVLLVVDATTGQNGISQAKLFNEGVGVTGIALTKLDGTSKGGIVINICRGLKIPIRFIGIGEQLEDLRDFNADDFVAALFQNREEHGR